MLTSRRSIASTVVALLIVPFGVAPAHAWIDTPTSGEVLAGIRTINENTGGQTGVKNMDEKTEIQVFNEAGTLVALWNNGSGGPLAVSWVTENHPNGAYRIRSWGRYCKRKIFGNCVDSEDRELSHFWVTVRNVTAIAYQGPTSGVWGDQVTLGATLWDATTGWAVVNRWVRFQVGDQIAYGLTNGSGFATASVTTGGSGTTTASATFDGDAYYVGSSAAASFSVIPVPAAVTIEGPFAGTWGNEVTVSALLHKAGPRTGALGGRPVTLSLGPRSASGVTDAAGRFSKTWLLDFAPGSYPLTLSFGGDAQVQAASGTATFGSSRRGTALVYAGAGASPWNDEAELAAYLLDPAGGVGVWGEVVRFQVGSRTVTAVTDVDGYARVMTPMTDDPGIYPVQVTYSGDATYAAASTSSAMQIVSRPTTLMLTVPGNGRWNDEVSATATLRDLVTGQPLAGRAVSFALGTLLEDGTTDAQGRVTRTLPLRDAPGSYGLTAVFAGETHYGTASVTQPFEILRRPLRVAFEGQRRADAAITGSAWASLGARVTDQVTGAPVAGVPLAVTAMDTTVALTSGADGAAAEMTRIARAPGTYPLSVATAGTAYYLPATSTSVSAVGWETFTDPDGDGAVLLDVAGRRVRAVAPLDDPAADTGVLDAPGLTVHADGTLALAHGGENDRVSGTFDPMRATFSASVEETAGTTRTLGRAANAAPAVTAPADLATDESATVALAASPADADGGPLYTWWDFGDQGSAPGVDVAHAYDDTVVDDRTFTVTVTTTDAAGARARDTMVVDVADIDAPAPPVIAVPAEGAALASGAVTVSGTVEAGAQVRLTDDGIGAGAPVVGGADGSWSIGLDLAEGAHRLRASAVDVDGYPSVPSAARSFLVDLTMPAVTVDGPLARAYNAARWASGCGLCGTAADALSGVGGVEVAVVRTADGTTFDGSGFVVAEPIFLPADGTTSWARSMPYDAFGLDGGYTVTARATDAAGNAATSPETAIEIDSVAPPAPAIASPAHGALLNRTDVEVRGTAERGATVTVLDAGSPVGGALAGDDGAWVATVTLDRGTHALSAVATDPAGNASVPGDAVAIEIDTDAPARPRVSSPLDGAHLPAPGVTLRGQAEARATLRVLDDGAEAASVRVADDGTYAVDLTLSEGAHTLTLTATDAATNVSEPSTHALTIDLTPPQAPSVASPAEGQALATLTPTLRGEAEPRSTIVVRESGATIGIGLTAADGTWEVPVSLPEATHDVTVAAIDAATNEGPSTPRTFELDVTPPRAPAFVTPDRSAVSSTTARLEGIADPGAEVVLTARRGGDSPVTPVRVIAGDDGRWSAELDLGEGDHVIVAEITDRAGNVSRDEVEVRLDVTPPVTPSVVAPFEGGAYATDRIDVRGTAEPGTVLEVAEDGAVLVVATASDDGTWRTSVTLADGPHALAIAAVDAAGNRSPLATRAFTIDTTPDVPVIHSPLAGARIDARVVAVTGEAPAGGTIEIHEGGTRIATARVSADATFALELPFTEGPHTIGAIATDPAGNVAPPSELRSFTIDTAAPLIVTPRAGATVGGNVQVAGNARPGEAVAVLEGDRTIGSTVAGPTGDFTLALPMAGGAHTIVAARIEDGAPRAPSDPRTFTVDDTAPGVTVTARDTYLPGDTIVVTGTAADAAGVVAIEVRYFEAVARRTVLGAPVCTGCATAATSVTFADRPALGPGLWRVDAFAVDAHGNRSARASASFVRI